MFLFPLFLLPLPPHLHLLFPFQSPLGQVLDNCIRIRQHLFTLNFFFGGIDHLLLKVLLTLQIGIILVQTGDGIDLFVIFLLLVLLVPLILIVLLQKLVEIVVEFNLAGIHVLRD